MALSISAIASNSSNPVMPSIAIILVPLFASFFLAILFSMLSQASTRKALNKVTSELNTMDNPRGINWRYSQKAVVAHTNGENSKFNVFILELEVGHDNLWPSTGYR